MHPVTIRVAAPPDANALSRLEALDGRRRPTGRVLLAERDGVALAALALTSGAAVADPARGTAALRVLRRRRYQLLRQGGDVGPAWSLLRRMALSA